MTHDDATASPAARPPADQPSARPSDRLTDRLTGHDTRPPSDPGRPRPSTYVARSPQDLVALVPVVLGFEPEDSVTMLTFGARRQFHARIDLPPSDDRGGAVLAELVAALVEPARRHGVRRVVLVLHTADRRLARRVAEALERSFVDAGIDLLHALRVAGERWWTACGPGSTGAGSPVQPATHPFRVRSVVEGRVTHASRADLARSIAVDEEAAAAVAAALPAATAAAPPAAPTSPEEVTALLDRLVPTGRAATDREVAGLLASLRDIECRDAAWTHMRRATAPDEVAFWSDVTRRAPEVHVADAAALLGFAAWLAGHGALAWCALDRALDAQPEHPMAVQVSFLLERAVPPHDWDRVRDLDAGRGGTRVAG
ncbi:DUF4192 domain-containing protein [Nocardioides sp. GY 10127]|uniref:DUF4192 domain-containing protein n=1 Tax=Nocardioides sp. GY 10127 TaxID=2569762 RepID=UPI0010A7D297|nr:DUF4192 domain-containing protein [Nocardioides sp. GY 10127]TIC85427.1 DUF4192 domain-containing protein [Nocardioides sp. GY 10127]